MEPQRQYRGPVGRAVVALRTLPPASATLLGLMCVSFVLETLASGASSSDTLIGFGASLRPYFIHGQYRRLVMPMFLHLSLAHLALNLVGLYLFGPLLERAYGCDASPLCFWEAASPGRSLRCCVRGSLVRALRAASWESARLWSLSGTGALQCLRQTHRRCAALSLWQELA